MVILLYINNNHYNLLYPKRENQKDKKIYSLPVELENIKLKYSDNKKFKLNKYNDEYSHVRYSASDNIYNEISDFFNSLNKFKNEIN